MGTPSSHSVHLLFVASRAVVDLRVADVGAAGWGVADAPAVTPAPRLLVVDSAGPRHGMPGVAAQGIAAMAERLGWSVTVVAGADSARLAPEHLLGGTDVALIVVHGEPPAVTRDPSVAWDGMARVTRSLVDRGVRVLAVRAGGSVAAVAACVERGAIGALHVDALADQLLALRPAPGPGTGSRGRARRAAEVAAERWQLPAPFHALTCLTAKERSVLAMLMEGCSAAVIARRLVVSISTVRAHIRSILVKLNVNSQLAAVAIAHGASLASDTTAD